ncbi:MAG: GNAT family N-acetyltransferase [Pseudomonadota bacterium]
MQDSFSDNIVIKIIQTAPENDLIQLYQQAGWLEPSSDGQTVFSQNIVKKSAVFAGAFDGEKMIGMGRALSDLISDAYIQDVTVLTPYRGRGIGGKIIQLLVKKLQENGVDWIGLVGEPGTLSFYEKLGFGQLEGYLPLKYKDQ